MNVQHITDQELDTLIAALIQVESGGNDLAVGTQGEVGCLQISTGVLIDYNSVGPKGIFKVNLEHLSIRGVSVAVCKWYLRYYGERVWTQRGVIPNFEVLARIWNGGPRGWQKPETQNYWLKVKTQLGS